MLNSFKKMKNNEIENLFSKLHGIILTTGALTMGYKQYNINKTILEKFDLSKDEILKEFTAKTDQLLIKRDNEIKLLKERLSNTEIITQTEISEKIVQSQEVLTPILSQSCIKTILVTGATLGLSYLGRSILKKLTLTSIILAVLPNNYAENLKSLMSFTSWFDTEKRVVSETSDDQSFTFVATVINDRTLKNVLVQLTGTSELILVIPLLRELLLFRRNQTSTTELPKETTQDIETTQTVNVATEKITEESDAHSSITHCDIPERQTDQLDSIEEADTSNESNDNSNIPIVVDEKRSNEEILHSLGAWLADLPE
jgi:hypothetical protein